MSGGATRIFTHLRAKKVQGQRGLMCKRSSCIYPKEIIRRTKRMPYKSTKLGCWVGQVSMTIEGEKYRFVLDRPHWKRKKPDADLFVYKKDQSRVGKVKFSTKRAAHAWEVEHEKEVRSGLTRQTAITFSVYSNQYLDQVEVTSTGDNTYRYKKRLILDVIQFYGHDPALPLEPLDIEQFLVTRARDRGPKNANRAKRELGTIFRWMIGKGIIDTNPITTIKKFPAEKFKKYVPTKEDILKVIAAAGAEEKDIIRVAIHSLARASELRRLKKEHCDFENNTVTLYTRKTEDGALEGGKIPINKNLREILLRRSQLVDSDYIFPGPSGEERSKGSLDKMLPQIFNRLNIRKEKYKEIVDRKTKRGTVKQGVWKTHSIPVPEDEYIPPFGLHSFRHHVTAHLYLYEGYTIGQLQKLLRHKKPTTTETYLRSIVDLDAPVGLEPMENFETSKPETADNNIHAFKG